MTTARNLSHLAHNKQLPDHVKLRVAEEDHRVKNLIGSDRTRRILIVGGSGYVGVPLTTQLLRSGYEVRNLDLHIYENKSSALCNIGHPNYDFVFGDLCATETLDQALDGVTDVVLLAGLVGDPITRKYPTESCQINESGIQRCIDHLNGRGLNKVVFVSTCSNYGLIPDGETADEEHELTPLSLYAKAKVAAETYILSQRGVVDYNPTILRFATAFGLAPRMRFDLTVNEFTRELALGNRLDVYDADTWRPYCHVSDFSSAIQRVLEFPVSDVSFETFNVGGNDNNITKRGLVDILRTRFPNSDVVFSTNSTDPRNYKVNFSKIRSKLFFNPSYSIDTGIDEIIWAFKSNLFNGTPTTVNQYGNYQLDYKPPYD
ncbi:MAG: NAD-dependent epimerase/dehydratase family protein [Hyphomicrobiaceae bacterium]